METPDQGFDKDVEMTDEEIASNEQARRNQEALERQPAPPAAPPVPPPPPEPTTENISAQCGNCKAQFVFPDVQKNVMSFGFDCAACGAKNSWERGS